MSAAAAFLPSALSLQLVATKAERFSLKAQQRAPQVRFGLEFFVYATRTASSVEDLIRELIAIDLDRQDPDLESSRARMADVCTRLALLSDSLEALLHASRESGLERGIWQSPLKRIADAQERLEDILESWQLALDDDFEDLVSDSLSSLAVSREESFAGLSR